MNDKHRSGAAAYGREKDLAGGARGTVHTGEGPHREGDAIAAARRRLPMVEVDATIEVDRSERNDDDARRLRRPPAAHRVLPRLVARPTRRAAIRGLHVLQQPGPQLSYIDSRDATYATLCKGPYEESVRYRDFMGLDMPWYSLEKTAAQLLEGRDWQRHTSTADVRQVEPVGPVTAAPAAAHRTSPPGVNRYGRQETGRASNPDVRTDATVFDAKNPARPGPARGVNRVWPRLSVGNNPNERTEAIMNDQAPSPALPPVVDRKTWQEAREALFRGRRPTPTKGTRSRRRLPMVEVDATHRGAGDDVAPRAASRSRCGFQWTSEPLLTMTVRCPDRR